MQEGKYKYLKDTIVEIMWSNPNVFPIIELLIRNSPNGRDTERSWVVNHCLGLDFILTDYIETIEDLKYSKILKKQFQNGELDNVIIEAVLMRYTCGNMADKKEKEAFEQIIKNL